MCQVHKFHTAVRHDAMRPSCVNIQWVPDHPHDLQQWDARAPSSNHSGDEKTPLFTIRAHRMCDFIMCVCVNVSIRPRLSTAHDVHNTKASPDLSLVHVHITANSSCSGFDVSQLEFVEGGMATCGFAGTKTNFVCHMFSNYQ